MNGKTEYERFRRLVGTEVELRSLREIVTYVLQLISDPALSAKQLAGAVSADPAIAARILAVANSAASGLGHRVNNVPQAIMLLGQEELRDIVASVAVFEKLRGSRRILFSRLWKHSLYCARISGIIAQNIGRNADVAYTAGLFHDIGKIVLFHSNERAFLSTVANYEARGGSMLHWEAEKQCLGICHDQIGAMAAGIWKFPEIMETAILNHHAPSTEKLSNESEYLSQIVYVADTLCWHLDQPSVGMKRPPAYASLDSSLPDSILNPLGLSEGRMADILNGARDVLREGEALLRSLALS